MDYAILRLLPKREKSVVNKHPWIYSGAVDGTTNALEGDIVEVHSYDKKVLGYGFFSQKSQIVCRMFDWQSKPSAFHSSEYWKEKIQTAQSIRKYINSAHTNCFRLIHAEGDFMPGLIVDVYNHVTVLQILVQGVEAIKEHILSALRTLGYSNFFIKPKANAKPHEQIQGSTGWVGEAYDKLVEVKENNLSFNVNIVEGQKTGFFIDQRDNRNLLKQYSEGKSVLNAFSYTGGFSVYALDGGATQVHSLDISKDAIQMANHNAHVNGYDEKHLGIAQDCFEYLDTMGEGIYDIVVLDPPAFAKHARAVDNAAKGYKQINLKAFQKVRSGGLVFTFSCSQHISQDLFQKIIFSAAADAQRNVRILHHLHQPSDHPVNIYHPEGEYLKGFVLWVD